MFTLGAAAGVLAASLAARIIVRRSARKAAVAERRARAAERMAEVGAMTGGLAHEIKNPLSTILLNAQLLSEGVDDLPQDRPADAETRGRLSRRIASLRREVERLRGILQDFLSYAGELRLEKSDVDLNTVVGELCDFFMPQAEAQGVRLRYEPAPEPVTALADAAHLKQALLNLMLNAVQAMAAGSANRELMLRVTAVKGTDRSTAAQVQVIDTGPGIPEELRERIFQPYFTTKGGGTGLGLPTTRRIVEAHEGALSVHSEMGKGTVFTITLPNARPLPPQA